MYPMPWFRRMDDGMADYYGGSPAALQITGDTVTLFG
jgi:hypothetical protein